MPTRIDDWPAAIGRLIQIKSAIHDVDHGLIWDYKLPRVAATAADLRDLEGMLGHKLDARHRSFLEHANGWPAFLQTVDLLGTSEMAGGKHLTAAEEILAAYEDDLIRRAGLADRSRLQPIAVTLEDRDLFVLESRADPIAEVVWLGGTPIDRFESFDAYFLSMIEYNLVELDRLKRDPEMTRKLKDLAARRMRR
jgi:hypothetical protein